MYRIAIADDNELHLKNMRSTVEASMDNMIQNITEFSSPDDIIEYAEIHGFPYDIVIMDIDFSKSKRNGISMASYIHSLSAECQVIFCTGYINFAPDVYDVEHTYFVLKTDMTKRLPIALKKAVEALRFMRNKMLHISVKGQEIIIAQNDILYLERMQRITQINLYDSIISCYESIEALMERLDPKLFVRCHKSYAVNLSKIRNYRKNSLTLVNNKLIPISRPNVKSTGDAFMQYLGDSV